MLKPKCFLEKFFEKNKIFKFLKTGSCILVKILKFKGKYILVDGNLKTLFFIKNNEFFDKKKYIFFIGKYVKVLIGSLDNGKGTPICSRENFFLKNFWDNIEFSLKKNLIVLGVLLNKIKGGFSVLLNKVRCFLPFSEVDKKILLNYYYYKKKKIKFNIINFNLKKNNIILSRKSLLHNFFFIKKISLINFLKTGYILKGIVKGISSYGVYIDLGYLDGLILTKNITWGPYKYANEVIEINQGVLVKVLKVDKIKNRIYLGMKQIHKNPWKNIHAKYKIGNIRYCRIFKITNENVHVVFERGVFGFLKKIKFSKNYKYEKFLNNIKINNYILVLVSYINIKKRFIGFKPYFKKKRKKIIKKIIKIKKIFKKPSLAQ